MAGQNTKLSLIQQKLASLLSDFIYGPWKLRSISLISLLLGYFIGNQVTVLFAEKAGQRTIVVLSMVLIVELMVRLRTASKTNRLPTYILAIDNLRIGAVYALVLEAFKLGS